MNLHLKELIHGSGIAFTFRIVGGALGYVFTLLITRNLGAEAMGIYALSLTVASIFSLFGKLGFDTATLRFVAEHNARGEKEKVAIVLNRIMKIVLPAGILLSVLMFLSSPFIADYIFHKRHLVPYFRIISLAMLPMILTAISSSSLQGLKKIKLYAFLGNMSNQVFSIIALLALLYFFNRNASVVVIAYSIASIFTALMAVLFLNRYIKIRKIFSPKKTDETFKLSKLLSVSFPMLLSSSMFLVMSWTDTIMLGIFRTEGDVGIYNVAMRVAGITSIMLTSVNSIAAPKFAEFYGTKDMSGLRDTVRQSTRMIFWTSFPILLILFTFPSFILGIFGNEFRAGVYALMILTFGQFINSVSGSVGYILQMTGNHKVFRNIIFTAALINIFLNYLLIPAYGITGAALASMVSMGFWNLCSMIYIKRSLDITTYYVPVVISNYK
jgi:O-antigen/teichoic acid export membrane protein